MITSSAKIELFDDAIQNNSIVSLQEHSYKPYGSPTFKNSDEIRIPINFQDLILDVSESFIYLEGKFEPTDPTKLCYLSNNALAFLFDEIRYEIGGEAVAIVRKPGISTTLKTMASFGHTQQKALESHGWGLSDKNQFILDKTSNVFSGKLPLKYLMGFAEDCNKAIFNVKQELVLIIARTFNNSYIGAVDASITIDKIEWKIRHIIPEDRQKLKILSRINKGGNYATIQMAYRMWDLYELPSLRQTQADIWAVRTATSLERPRYIIIGFQSTENCDKIGKDATQFISADLCDIRLYLNSVVFPYERWNLDFSKKLVGAAYYAYENFQKTYYDKECSEPSMNIEEYTKNPIFIIDCLHQLEAIKSSTVDIKIEFHSKKIFPTNTKVYALVIHDSVFTYNVLSGSVSKKASF